MIDCSAPAVPKHLANRQKKKQLAVDRQHVIDIENAKVSWAAVGVGGLGGPLWEREGWVDHCGWMAGWMAGWSVGWLAGGLTSGPD